MVNSGLLPVADQGRSTAHPVSCQGVCMLMPDAWHHNNLH
jgi:hypothetical protein